MRSESSIIKTVDLLRLCAVNLKKDCEDISTEDDLKDLVEIDKLCTEFLQRKGMIK